MALKKLIIRADASISVGTGHVMRCLALAQAWQDKGGDAIFVLTNKSSALENRLISEGMQVVYLLVETGSQEDANQTVDFAQKFNKLLQDLSQKLKKYIIGPGFELLSKKFEVENRWLTAQLDFEGGWMYVWMYGWE